MKKEKIFIIICLILAVFNLRLLFVGEIDLGLILSSLVLIVTALAIGIQAFATAKIAEYQIIPSIEMFLIYHKDGGSSFAFYNLSPTPGIITFHSFFKQNQKSRELNYNSRGNRYRIPPQGILITASTFFTRSDLPTGIEVRKDLIIRIQAVIVPDLDGISPDIKRTYKKSYKFIEEQHLELNDKRWNEELIGFPDILCFTPENIGLRESVKFVIKNYLEKPL